ncbi:MAG TPA: hypothetical protein VF895_08460 [Gaiellaceae bacterium]
MKSLDDFLPEYEFSERHRILVEASPERIDRAIREVTVEEMPLVRVLMTMRGMPHRGRLVDVIGQLGTVLEDAPGEGLVVGVRGQFWRWEGTRDNGPLAEAVADFRIEDRSLSTETRVHVEDPTARRRFARYWQVIRPFSGLIRILFLRAARRRAEAQA